MTSASSSGRDAALLLFRLGERRYAIRADEVVRVVALDAGEGAHSPLGSPRSGRRGLVSRSPAGGRALAVDEIEGVIEGAPVHQLPALAAACMADGAICGLIEWENELLPLVDLPAVLREQPEREDVHGAERGASQGEGGDQAADEGSART